MKVRKPFGFAVAAAAAVLLPLHAAHAAGYSSQLIEDDVNPTDVHMDGCTPGSNIIGNQTVGVLGCKPSSKVTISASKKKGDGGLTFQIVMKKVTCGGSPCTATGHVIELNLRAVGNDIPCLGQKACTGALPFAAAAGLPFNLSGGIAGFPGAGGKNKIGAGSVFGLLSNQIFTRSIGIGLLKLHKPGSNPADCSGAPLLDGNGCIDGDVYAVAGFAVPTDPANVCSNDEGCPAQDSCVIPPGACSPTPCTSVADCRTVSGTTLACDVNGSGQCCTCGTNGNCAAGVCP